MPAFVAPSSDPDAFFYDPAFRKPSLGDLHAGLTGLPSDAREVMLEVLCSSVNPADRYADAYLKPKPLGSDVVGRVVETNGSSAFNVGDLVWGDIGANALLESNVSVTTKELGAYAGYAVALDSQLALAPLDFLPLLELCSLPKVALTAYKALVWYAGAPWNGGVPGSPSPPRVLVLGGSGGTGSAGIQLAKAFGAASIATTTSSENFAYCTSLGATQLIDYHSEDWWTVIKEGEVDVIFDTVGEDGTAASALALLSKRGGRFVTIAGTLADDAAVPPGTTQAKFINSDTNLVSAPELWALNDVIASGALRMPSLSIYGIDQVSEAFATSAAGHVVGKLVISVRNLTLAPKIDCD